MKLTSFAVILLCLSSTAFAGAVRCNQKVTRSSGEQDSFSEKVIIENTQIKPIRDGENVVFIFPIDLEEHTIATFKQVGYRYELEVAYAGGKVENYFESLRTNHSSTNTFLENEVEFNEAFYCYYIE